MKTSIFQTLEKLRLTSTQTRSVFNTKTRDVDDLIVWKDNVSGVIYIDDFYTGDETYEDGSYRQAKVDSIGKPDYERFTDAKRRFNTNLQHVTGKRVMDFGCGAGDFLRLIKNHSSSVCGSRLQQSQQETDRSFWK